MTVHDHAPKDTTKGASAFPPTRWSLVLQASDASGQALAELCRIYWRPVYLFLRRQGNTAHDAEDLTQGFFAKLIEHGSLATVSEAKGRLRSFLLVAVKRFAASQHERAQALKRGGGIHHVPIDVTDAEEHYAVEPIVHETPERLFEKHWALVLLDEVMLQVRADYERDGRAAIFDALKDRLTFDGSPESIAQTGDKLGMTEDATKVALHRLRQRYAKRLHSQIAQTVDSTADVQDEITHLLRLFGRD